MGDRAGREHHGQRQAMRVITFSSITTTKIRVVVNNGRAHYSRIIEVEAFSCLAP
ncbi:MAG: hypothetical protein LC754_13450 [Acidobacteria bacterium]|nr:hypothetical protein [Acidobacteriota bacterium]